MLSISRGFLFVHIPKTGGNAVQTILRAYSEDQIVCLTPLQDGIERFELRNARYPYEKHSSFREYESMIEADLFAKLYKFACVRNPWDRIISYYFSPHRQVHHWDRDGFIGLLDEVRPMVSYLDERSVPADARQSGATFGMNRIMRFERLQEDFDSVCADLGLPRRLVPNVNASRRGLYKEYLDESLRELVAERYHADIARFGYTFADT